MREILRFPPSDAFRGTLERTKNFTNTRVGGGQSRSLDPLPGYARVKRPKRQETSGDHTKSYAQNDTKI